jgi:hypothetical protein
VNTARNVQVILKTGNFLNSWELPFFHQGLSDHEADYYMYHIIFVTPDSSVGLDTSYDLDGPGIESLWGRDFPHTSRQALEPIQPPTQWVPGVSRGKATGVWL